ncbi:MAG: hypothetical protein KC438_04040, partial [Thermomicrobiales bacterium]|nr:hypothetical protein [Thermomicrobiales bacterium]
MAKLIAIVAVLVALAAPIAGPTMLGSSGSGDRVLAQDGDVGVSTADASPESDGAVDEEPVDQPSDGEEPVEQPSDGEEPIDEPIDEQPGVDEPVDETTDEVPSEEAEEVVQETVADASVEVASDDEVVVPAALPAGVVNIGCQIPNPAQPDLRRITLVVTGAAGYGPPEVSGTVTRVDGTVEPFSFSGAGNRTWGPDPGYAAIEVFAEY